MSNPGRRTRALAGVLIGRVECGQCAANGKHVELAQIRHDGRGSFVYVPDQVNAKTVRTRGADPGTPWLELPLTQLRPDGQLPVPCHRHGRQMLTTATIRQAANTGMSSTG
jgi:hypothetical protein